MNLGPNESLEDYEERFQWNYKRDKSTLDPGSLKFVLLQGIREELIVTLDMLSGRDIYQIPYETIKTLFWNHSRAVRKKCRVGQSTSNTPSSSTSIKHEIGNMLEDFKSDILHTFALQMDCNIPKWEKQEYSA